MPQDSTYVMQSPADTAHMPDSLRQFADAHSMQAPKDRAGEANKDYTGTALLLVVVIVAIVLGIPWLQDRLRRRLRMKYAEDVYEGKHMQYDRLLHYYLPYYRTLRGELRDRFLRRTVTFMESKDFEYVNIEAEEKMPLLISAAAVQLTFGLEHYLLDYFNKIFVLRESYHFGLYNVPFEGHVSSDGIYLSWSNFAKEFADYYDGSNVGLHEMAHALAYVNFSSGDGKDSDFQQRFIEFSKVARPEFEQAKAVGSAGFMGEYAASSYHEFWAVCVENFFERPVLFRQSMPRLYEALASLLNQDSLQPQLLLSPVQST